MSDTSDVFDLDTIEIGAEDCTLPRHWAQIHRLCKKVRELEHLLAQLKVANARLHRRLADLQDKTPCTCEDVAHDTPLGSLVDEVRRLRGEQ